MTDIPASDFCCPSCGAFSGDDWSQCNTSPCPMGGPPKAANQLSGSKEETLQQQVQAALFECPACKSKGFPQSKLPGRCEFCDGTFSGNPPTAEEIIEANDIEQAQADSLEAHSLKYQACAQIMQLSSGRFALFGAYHAGGGSGIELIAIGEWADLEPHVREYKQLADATYARGQERTLPAKTTADYDSLFGDQE